MIFSPFYDISTTNYRKAIQKAAHEVLGVNEETIEIKLIEMTLSEKKSMVAVSSQTLSRILDIPEEKARVIMEISRATLLAENIDLLTFDDLREIKGHGYEAIIKMAEISQDMKSNISSLFFLSREDIGEIKVVLTILYQQDYKGLPLNFFLKIKKLTSGEKIRLVENDKYFSRIRQNMVKSDIERLKHPAF